MPPTTAPIGWITSTAGTGQWRRRFAVTRSFSATWACRRPCCPAACCRGRASPTSLLCCVCGARGVGRPRVRSRRLRARGRCPYRRGAYRRRLLGRSDPPSRSVRRLAGARRALCRGRRRRNRPAYRVRRRRHVYRRRPHRPRARGRLRRVPPLAAAWRAGRRHQLGGARSRRNEALPEWARRVDCATWFATAGFTDIVVVERPRWTQRERALFDEAANLDPAGDDAITSLRDEAIAASPAHTTGSRIGHRAAPRTGALTRPHQVRRAVAGA